MLPTTTSPLSILAHPKQDGSEQGFPAPWWSEVDEGDGDDDAGGGGGMNCLASGDMMALNALSVSKNNGLDQCPEMLLT